MNWYRELKLSYIGITDRSKCFWLTPKKNIAATLNHYTYVVDEILSKITDEAIIDDYRSLIERINSPSELGDFDESDEFDDGLEYTDEELDSLYYDQLEILESDKISVSDRLLSAGVSMNESKVLLGGLPPDEFAIREWGWIKINGKEAQVKRVNYLTTDRVSNFMILLYGEFTKARFVIGDLSSGKYYENVPLWELPGDVKKLEKYLSK